ncbi:MAG: vancomycin resistance protein [Candidatus Aegiribacteria sp.]|nr:vancomycin resistance protein [Candidatus Aegiribacteria sp.]MBD3293929.1 vancomycin resistance protein [Candidatus Fermentibacteria bacterium]
MNRGRPLSSRNRFLYGLSVFSRRMARRFRWYFGGFRFPRHRNGENLPELIMEHSSVLIKRLENTPRELQVNKVRGLKIAASRIDGILLKPGEIFSFWRLVGNPTVRRGFLPGLQLSFGKMVAMTGGGLCQMSNLLHWMVLHTPMEVTERHRHDFDPFPDSERTVPFGTGATVFYNYLDLMFVNPTKKDFQLKLWLDETHLRGEIRCSTPPVFEYSVEERNHLFLRRGEEVFRKNEIWKVKKEPETGKTLSSELLFENECLVRYDVSAIPDIEVEEQ